MAEPTEYVLAPRSNWIWTGANRPPWADTPRQGQESVWDYPRPPAIVPESRRVTVSVGDSLLVDTTNAVRVLETAGAPTFYIPFGDIALEQLAQIAGSSICEWKGAARSWAHRDDRSTPIGWDYPDPYAPFEPLAEHLSFYPARVTCTVGGEVAHAQPGGLYGGWVTDEIAGPIKGGSGSGSW